MYKEKVAEILEGVDGIRWELEGNLLMVDETREAPLSKALALVPGFGILFE